VGSRSCIFTPAPWANNVVTPSFLENVPLITHVSIENVFTSLEEKIVSVCQDTLTKLYGKDNFCRKHVFYINESIEVVNKVIVDSAKQLFLDKLPKEFQPDSFLKFCYTPFKNISTEHKLLKKTPLWWIFWKTICVWRQQWSSGSSKVL